MASRVAVGVLGPVTVDGVALPLPRQQRLLLSALAVAAPRGVSRARLIDGLWGDAPPSDARKALQVLVARLRKSLAGSSVDVVLSPDGYRLALGAGEVDAAMLSRAFTRERTLPTTDLPARRRLLEETLDLVRGEPFADLAAEPLLVDAAVSLTAERDAVTERLHDVRLQLGESEELLAELTAWASSHPLDEAAWSRLAVALHRAGRPTEALRALHDHRRTVRDLAGIEPTAAIDQLEAELLGTPTREPARSGPGLLVPAARAVLGREREVAELDGLVDGHRLVTLVGAPGIGKTTLAVHAVAAVRDRYRDGAWMCELAEVATDDAVVEAVATALGVRRRRGMSLLASVVSAFRGAEAILVLDNCEHVLEAAAELVTAVQRECAGVTTVATSREPLGLSFERLYPVGPLAVHGADGAGPDGGPAVELFLQRAHDAGVDMGEDAATKAAVAGICRKLDGLPLAIELAAGRCRSMAVGEMGDRLDERFHLLARERSDGPGRHRTLWDAVEWSYRLLGPAAQELFTALSVFLGGFTVAAAAAASGRDRAEAEEIVWTLVDRSMLTAAASSGGTRYHMLETLRQFGTEVLAQSDRGAAVRAAHAAYYVAFAGDAGAAMTRRDEALHVARITEEIPNLRAAHQHLVTNGPTRQAATLVTALHEYAMWRQFFELGDWATTTLELDLAGDPSVPALHAIAGWGLSIAGDYDAATAQAELGLAAERNGGRECGWLHDVLAHCAYFRGDVRTGLAHADAEIARARASGDQYRLSYVLADSGVHAGLDEDADPTGRCRERAGEALALARACANPSATAMAYLALGFGAEQHDPALATDWFQRAVELGSRIESHWLVGVSRAELAYLLALHGDPVEAVALGRDLVVTFRRAGDTARVRGFVRGMVPALVQLLAPDRWSDLVVLEAGTNGRQRIREPIVETAVATAMEQVTARLGPAVAARAAAVGEALDDDAVFDLATSAMDGILHEHREPAPA